MKNKTNLSKIKDDYTKIPNKVRDLNLPLEAIGLYALIASFPDNFNPSLKYLKSITKIGHKKIKKQFDILETCGIIRKVSSGSFQRRIVAKYELRPVVEWRRYESED
jgi:hypothetical protein